MVMVMITFKSNWPHLCSIDKKQNIAYIFDPVCRYFIINVDSLFKPTVLFQNMNRTQENLPHTADLTDDCSIRCQIPWLQERL